MKIFELLNKMAASKRWSQADCLVQESVLEHTAFVALHAMHLCYKYDQSSYLTVTKALLHDIEEAIIGDIPTPTKYSSPAFKAEVDIIAAKAAKKISAEIFDYGAFSVWHDAKNLGSGSGQIVAVSDSAAVVNKIERELSLGNSNFKEFIPNIEDSLFNLRIDVDDIMKLEVDLLLNKLEDLK